ncbi:hypothetical protein A5320_16320 [Rheinheimera sp. SA_1]|uniref:DNA/RNA helicase domain-containing protein n=1 Tax=Rheinheimera sp. SA_1 TaxID=1827365 RepID=UPI0007FDE4E0|nr:DNA/RNA helicase domain-containing protein [Rheinheimera sp. SA_1]OBP14202.1 hypothetical protein A5320_16320 [Rheinheimera sp. SA_1]
MKSINILSLVQACNSLEDDLYAIFLEYYGVGIREQEAEDLSVFTESLYDLTDDQIIFDRYYVGYKIPQISKEFDLLRFGFDCVINVEIKSSSSEDKMLNQLVRNKSYLSYLGKKVHNFSFVSSVAELFYLNDSGRLEKVELSMLEKLLREQVVEDVNDIDDLFNPSDYLVSPFNSTKKFIENCYFLTNQQEEIKNRVISSLQTFKTEFFVSITGGAGTGKTLLVYDIVKSLRSLKKKTLIIHCGYLNDGQEFLRKKGWDIIPIKNYKNVKLSNYDAVFIDEVQRIYPEQLQDIIESVRQSGGGCIFSYDKLQTLSSLEESRDIDSKINLINSILKYNLTEKIRTNKEISTFVKMIFNEKRNLKLINKGNVELNYFKNIEDAKAYVSSLDCSKWEVLRFTPSQYNNEFHEKYSEGTKQTSHRVIGQEFDGVAVTIDQFFSYDKNGELTYIGRAHYKPVKMLFQNMTRARKRLNIIIISNVKILERCLYILKL